MKKRIFILSLILILMFIPLNSFGQENLIITKWVVDSILLENGDLEVSEDIEFDFRDRFNGVYRDIVLEGTDGIENLSLYEMKAGQEVEYKQEINPEKGDSNVFKSTMEGNRLNLMIFSPSNKESKTFRIKYIIKNVSKRHSDTGELYYKFLGAENQTPINHFSATVDLPSMDKERIKIFAHGPLNGQINFAADNMIKLEVDNVPTRTFVEARILFPLDYISSSTKTGNRNLKEIIDEELALINKAQQNDAKREKNKGIFNTISIILTGVGTLALGMIYNRYRRDPSVYNNMNSLIPDDISPAELTLFMKSMLDGRSIIATLFDLARREYITISTIEYEEEKNKSWLSKYKEKEIDYIFTKTEQENSNLLSHEEFFMDWIFNIIGNGETVSTLDIDKSRKKSNYHRSYSKWNEKVMANLKSRQYHDPNSSKVGIGFLLLSFPLLLVSVFSLINGGLYGIGLIILTVLVFIMSIILMTRKSDEGFIQHGLWKDFMKNMDVFDRLDGDVPRDKYMIYAIALGLTMEKMDKYRIRVGTDYYPMYWGMFYYSTLNRQGGSRFEDRINNSFYGSTGSSSATSSSIGGGGGFSGGGGGGAGGGGAGGF